MTATALPDATGHSSHARLRILGTSDLHVHLLGYDYYADRPCPGTGLAHTAALVAAARREVDCCVLLDNGDFLQGNPMGDYVMQPGVLGQGHLHPAIRVMNRIGYDAATLGNHEFNYGLEALMQALAGAQFPVVSANIARRLGASPEADDTLLPPYCLIRRQITDDRGQSLPLCIGVIGFAPPQIVQWDRQWLDGRLQTRGIVEVATALVPRLRQAGADIVVALSHSGIGVAEAGPCAENATTALAQVPGIDAIIAGHSHLVFPSAAFAGMQLIDATRGMICGTPVVMPGFNGSHLGVIDLNLRHSAQGWQVEGFQVEARSVLAANPDAVPEILADMREDHAATVAYTRRAIGRTAMALHSFFATIAPSPALALVAQAQAQHVAQQVAGRPEAALPILSAVSPFKAGGRGGPQNYTEIPAGKMALRHAADLYIFPNTIAALRLTGADLADWLENAMGLFQRIPPGAQDHPLIDEDFPSYNHDCILGLSFEIDLTQPARYDRHGALRHPEAQRVQNLRFQGQPIPPQTEFLLATNSYRAAGCGGYSGARPERLVDVGRMPIRDVLLRFIAQAPVPSPLPAGTARFQPMPGTTVIYDTAPDALPYLADIAHFTPQFLGQTDEGFARFRLHL